MQDARCRRHRDRSQCGPFHPETGARTPGSFLGQTPFEAEEPRQRAGDVDEILQAKRFAGAALALHQVHWNFDERLRAAQTFYEYFSLKAVPARRDADALQNLGSMNLQTVIVLEMTPGNRIDKPG